MSDHDPETGEVVEARVRRRQPTATDKDPYVGGLADFKAAIEKTHGGHIVRRATDIIDPPHLMTGVFVLDYALLGGIPAGAITMIYGWQSSGKSTLCLKVIASAQRKHPEKRVVLIDIEGTYSKQWGELHGVDNNTLILLQPDNGEQAADLAWSALKIQDVSLVVLDSIAAVVPTKETERSMSDNLVGEQSRLIGRFMRTASNTLARQKFEHQHFPALVLTNQWRNKIGIAFGDPRVLPGGHATNFFSSLKIEVKAKPVFAKDAEGNEVAEHNVHNFKIEKNKVGGTVATGEWQMVRSPDNPLGAGFIDDGKTIVSMAKKLGLVTGGGGSFRLHGVEPAFRRLDEIVEFLYNNEEVKDALVRQIIGFARVKHGLPAEFT